MGSTDSVDEEREIEDVWRETKVRARTREVLRADANCFAVPRIVPHANVTSFVHVCESALAKASRPCVALRSVVASRTRHEMTTKKCPENTVFSSRGSIVARPMSATRASSARFARPKTMPRSRGNAVSAVSSVEPSTSTAGWTQKVITLEPKQRGIFIWTHTLRGALPEMRDVRGAGMLNLFVQSSTCALSINENCDPDVRSDMQNALDAMFPGSDTDRTSAVGVSIDLPVRAGALALGTWQGLYLLASGAGPVTVVATLYTCSDQSTLKHVTLKAPARGAHEVQDTLDEALESIKKINNNSRGPLLINVTAKHTSASLAIMGAAVGNESCHNLEPMMNALVPEKWNYPGHAVTFRHTDEGDDDMPAHVKSSLLGVSKTIPVDLETGELMLRETQGVFLCEHRNGGGFGGTGGSRSATVTVLDKKVCIGQTVIEVVTTGSGKRVDVTETLQKTLEKFLKEKDAKASTGLLHVFARNSAVSLSVGEKNKGITEGVTVDTCSLTATLNRLVCDCDTTNLPALVGNSVSIPFRDGALLVSETQSLFIAEHAAVGGRRSIAVTATGDVTL